MYGGRRDEMEVAQLLIEEQFGEAAFINAASQCGYDPAALQQLIDEEFCFRGQRNSRYQVRTQLLPGNGFRP